MIKQFVILLSVAMLSLVFLSQCTGSKSIFQQNPPFSVSDAHYQDWVGGQPGNIGTSVHINITAIDGNVRPDTLFFRDKKAAIYIKTGESSNLWVANFRSSTPRDINMYSDPKEEYGNKAPSNDKFPFELSENEAVISYYVNEKRLYYKITDLQKKQTLFLPSTKPEQ